METEECGSGPFSKTEAGYASYSSGPRRRGVRVWLWYNLLLRHWTLLRPAASWKLAAPVFAKGDFCRDGERARRYLLLPFLPRHPLQHSCSQSHDTSVMQLTLFIQARLVPPCFQTTFCKSCLYFTGGSFGSKTVQNWEDLKHSLSPIYQEIYPTSCRNTWYRTRVHHLHSRKQEPRKATVWRKICTVQHAKVNLKA